MSQGDLTYIFGALFFLLFVAVMTIIVIELTEYIGSKLTRRKR